MTANRESIYQFLQFCDRHIQGKERSDAQIFLNEFFKAFGHKSAAKAGAKFELPIPKAGHTGYTDLWWPRDKSATLLIEMKSRGTNLNRHYGKTWDYCKQLNSQPKYVILCNFDEFWIYDFEIQIDTPLDKVCLLDLGDRLEAFRFMELTDETPVFQNNQVEITQAAAKQMGKFYRLLKGRSHKAKFDAVTAQKFTLQCVMAMFIENTKLLNFLEIQRNLPCKGEFRGIESNQKKLFSTLFSDFYPIELSKEELDCLKLAANQDWSKVRPAIFGNIFESTINGGERHQGGIHFTSENDMMKIIRPTISRYWEEKIETANDLKELEQLKIEMGHYQVLDPACGSGNFLYMAYQELKQMENLLLQKSAELKKTKQLEMSFVTQLQFHGIDRNSFAVDLARVTLLIARKVAIDKLGLTENSLPLDSLDRNIIQGDALFIDWPKVQAIIGNPPFQSKNKMQKEFGAKYVNQIREKYPEIPGRADYCVYWFYKAHQQLPEQGRAGLIGTNTIRENYSREGGLDYIVKHKGTITEAVSTQVWSGDATVRIAIVNWIKGDQAGKKQLSLQLGDKKDSPWQIWELDDINSSLSAQIDVSQAKKILTNAASKCCCQGQTHGHEDFLLTPVQYQQFIQQNSLNQEVMFPYLIGEDLLSTYPPLPKRYIIDFHPQDLKQASQYKGLIKRVKERVLSTRDEAAEEEKKRNQEVLKNNPKARVNRHHKNFLAKWWLLSYPRAELIEKLHQIPRYIVCSRVSKRPVFEFVDSNIRPNDALQVFPLADDYSFGILQSDFHWQWFIHRCSTLGSGFRYTSDTVFDTFPFPQSPTLEQIQRVAENAVNLRKIRRRIMAKNQWNLRELYRNLTDNPKNSDSQNLQQVQNSLDQAVAIAYGMDSQINPLEFLLNLNLEISEKEIKGAKVIAPGLPDFITNPASFTSQDCISL